MPTFGKYETAQRLFLSGMGGIYALKSDEKKIIKVLHPPVGIWSEERTQEEIEGFKQRAKIQKTAARASQNWAPVHEVASIRDAAGTGESTGGEALASVAEGEARPPADGAYVVMDRYERSAQSLLDGRVNVQNADLRALYTGIFQGLRDLQQSAGRAHGALKAANILLTNSTDLATATVHLSDPASEGMLTPESAYRDLHQLARMLYQLVNKRPYDDGTIGRNKAWDALGPNGEDWRKLCGMLMDPKAHPAECQYEKILAQIQTWTAKPKKSKKPLLLGVVALLLIAGGITAFMMTRPKHAVYSSEVWQKESLAYYAWFEDFTEQVLNDKKGALYGQLQKDYPGYVKEIEKAKDKYFPMRIAYGYNEAKPAFVWKDLIATPPQAVTEKPGPDDTVAGWKLVENVSKALEDWKVSKALEEAIPQFTERGWKKPGEYLEAVRKAARPPNLYAEEPGIEGRYAKVEADKAGRKEPIGVSLGNAVAAYNILVNGLEEGGRRIDGANVIWKRLEGMEHHNLALPQNLRKYAAAFAPGNGDTDGTLDDLKTLTKNLDVFEREALMPLKAALATANVDYGALAGDPLATAEPALEVGALRQAYRELAGAVGGYVKVANDPRKVTDWKQQLKGVRDVCALIAKDILVGDADGKVLLDKIVADCEAAEKQIKEVADLPLLVKSNIGERSDKILALLKTVTKESNNHPSYMNQEKFDAFVTLQNTYTDPSKLPGEMADAAVLKKAPKPVQEQWSKAQGALVKTVRSKTLEAYRTSHVQDETQFKYLVTFYAAVGLALPENDADRAALLKAPWAEAAKSVAEGYRESLLAEMLAGVKVPENPPPLESAEYRGLRDGALAKYKDICKKALELIGDYEAIKGGLDKLQLLTSEAAAGRHWNALYKKWGGAASPSALLKDTAVAAMVQPIDERVKKVLEIEGDADLKIKGETDYKVLLSKAQAPVAEVALTAWRKLGTVAEALTKDPAALDETVKAKAALTGTLSKAQADAGNLKTIQEAMAAQGKLFWGKWAELAGTDKEIENAVSKAGDFGVTLTAGEQPAMYYYKALLELRGAYGKAKTAADPKGALKKPAEDFIAAVGALPKGVLGEGANKASGQALVEMMKKALDEKVQDTSTKQGPELAGWTVQMPSDQVRIFTAGDPKLAKYSPLEFQMINAGGKTVYVCTTEMPVGLFAAVMNLDGKLGDLDNARKKAGVNDHWFDVRERGMADKGIYAWSINVGKKEFEVSQEWLGLLPPQATVGAYPANGTPRVPGELDPVQMVSPWAAMYAANLMGCRLSTSEEWGEAYRQFEDREGLPKDVWNLRGEGKGASWMTQQKWASENNFIPLPDENIYLNQGLLNNNNIQGKKANAWTANGLAALAPKRFTGGAGVYGNSTLWFAPVKQENVAAGGKVVMHHLVGNVAEFAFDGEGATEPLKSNKVTAEEVDKKIPDAKQVYIMGGSALSPPEMPFNVKQAALANELNMYSDVGFRLTYTAPKDTIVQVLKRSFEEAKTLPGPRAK